MLLPNLDSLWNFSDPAATEAEFRKLLAFVEMPEAIPMRLEILTQIARALGLQKKFEQAHEVLDEVASGLLESMTAARIRYLLERGRVWNSSKKPELAMPLFEEAWMVAMQAREDVYAIDAAHMMAIVSPAEALDWNLKAVALAKDSQDPKAKNWLGPLYNNLGWDYHDRGEYTKALEFFEDGVRWRAEKGEAKPLHIALWAKARALRSLDRLEEALALQLELLEKLEQNGEKDGYVFEEIGENLLGLGRGKQAAAYFAFAHEELSKDAYLAKSEPRRLERLQKLALGS